MTCELILALRRVTTSRQTTIFRKSIPRSREAIHDLVPTTPIFTNPRRLLLEMARERAPPDLLRLAVDRLAESPRVALARTWLLRRSEDGGEPHPRSDRGSS